MSSKEILEAVTACTLDCPDTCSLVVTRDSRGAVRLKGNPDHPFTAGFTCRKSRGFIRRLGSPHRITHPMLRTGEQWRSLSWDDALDLCAEKLGSCRAEPASILHIHGEGAKGVMKQAGKLFFAMLGASRVSGSLCDAAGYVACLADFGSRLNNDITDLLHSRCIVNWGRDLSRSSVHTAALIRRARELGSQVISISPGGDDNSGFSDDRVCIRPGTDRFLAAAVIRRFIEEDIIGDDVLSRARQWPEFRELVMKHAAADLAAWCDVDPRDVERVFCRYAQRGPTATILGAGLQRYAYGGENVRFINALAFLSGNIGREGGGSYFHLHSLRNVNLNWTKDPERKPRRAFPVAEIGRSILEADDPPVRMLWINGSNVINQAPDSRQTARAFESVPFKVVVDAFMTDTAQRADLFLPCTLMLEQEDIVASYLHDFVHYVPAVVQPPAWARSDHRIFRELGVRLDPPVVLPDPEAIFRASLDSPHLSVSLEELRAKRFVRAGRPRIAYAGMRFDHTDGKYRFPPELHAEPPASPEYPLRLLTLIRREHIHSQILPEDQAAPPPVWISPDSPHLKNLDLRKNVFMVSPLGRLMVQVKTRSGLHPHTVVYRRGDWMKLGGGANQLIQAGLTDIGGGAPFYQQHVRLENE